MREKFHWKRQDVAPGYNQACHKRLMQLRSERNQQLQARPFLNIDQTSRQITVPATHVRSDDTSPKPVCRGNLSANPPRREHTIPRLANRAKQASEGLSDFYSSFATRPNMTEIKTMKEWHDEWNEEERGNQERENPDSLHLLLEGITIDLKKHEKQAHQVPLFYYGDENEMPLGVQSRVHRERVLAQERWKARRIELERKRPLTQHQQTQHGPIQHVHSITRPVSSFPHAVQRA